MTNGRSGDRPPDKPRLAPDDADIWRKVASSVEPLRRRRRVELPADDGRPSESVGEQQERPRDQRPRRAPQAPAARTSVSKRDDPGMTGIDRRMRQKLARGQVDVDARIDLHGSTRAAARGRLLAFLVEGRARGHRTVLVITGKGEAPFARHTLHGSAHFHTPERQGVLRQAVTEWFAEPDFAAVISGFQPAHPKHGGGGAFYVRLRRQRSRP